MAQIIQDTTTTGGPQLIYQVTATQTLQVTNIYMTVINDDAAAQNAVMYITNSVDVIQDYLFRFFLLPDSLMFLSRSFPKPLIIEAEFKVYMLSSNANLQVSGGLHGFEL